MKSFLAKAVIVVRPQRGGKRHATPIGSERLGKTFCGRSTESWTIDADGPPDCATCRRGRSFG